MIRRKTLKRGASKIFTISNQILIYTVSHKVADLQRKTNIVTVALILLTFQLKMKKSTKRSLQSRSPTLFTITIVIRLTSTMITICFQLHKSSIFRLVTWHIKSLSTLQMKCFWIWNGVSDTQSSSKYQSSLSFSYSSCAYWFTILAST